jgi:hypothetical protein
MEPESSAAANLSTKSTTLTAKERLTAAVTAAASASSSCALRRGVAGSVFMTSACALKASMSWFCSS